VLPYLRDLRLAEEDAASLETHPARRGDVVEISVVRLPHLANFDEFGKLAAEPGVGVRYVSQPSELRAPDLVVVPGTKASVPDLRWLHATGIAERIVWLARHGTPVLGICGGFQMLGRSVRDRDGIESDQLESAGLGLLPADTEIGPTKHLDRVRGRFTTQLPGVWRALSGLAAEGYEMHMGHTRQAPTASPLLHLGLRCDGAVSADGGVAATYVHGLFERADARSALITALAHRRGLVWRPRTSPEPGPYDLLADAIEANLDLAKLGLDP
jgi:adenosylcobyric acid synthase